MKALLAAFDWRSRAVLRRNLRVFIRNWKTAFFPPAMEPVVFFMVFGLGLGSHVALLSYAGRDVPYATWVAPGLLAYTGFSTPFFEALYASYVRMNYQKTWDGILATQVELEHIVWGEIFWAALRGTSNCAIVASVLLCFYWMGVVDIDIRWLWVPPLLAGLAGCAFGAFALIFTAIVPAIDHMNYPVFLVGLPLGMVSNTYFPVETQQPLLQVAIQLNPVYHLAESTRALLVGGEASQHLAGLVVTAGVLLLLCMLWLPRLMRRRVLGG